jgi:hypothetical protein
MARIEDSLRALAQGVRWTDAKEMAQRRASLEADLETMVRCALRTGTGTPALVRWVQTTLPALTGEPLGGKTEERAAPALARLLCRTLINRYRPPHTEVARAGRETVVDS